MKQIAAALVKAQRGFSPALKTSSNPHFRSKYADLSACVEAVIDSLNANGIFLMQPIHESESGVIVETLFVHESGETMSAGRLHVPASKQDAQGYGSAITYGRRYSLMAACGIAPEDDDGNAASKARRTELRITGTDGAMESLDDRQRKFVAKVAAAIAGKLGAGNDWGAYEELTTALDKISSGGGDAQMFQVALWSVLDAPTRKALESMRASDQQKEAA